MSKFEYKYKIIKSETTYGSICLNNIKFEPSFIEDALPEIVLNDNNLKHMFAEVELDSFKKRNIYCRFIPNRELYSNLDECVEAKIRFNKSFYSFLAEGILGLVFRDIYSFELAKGIIDINQTLTDQHTGVDACMYNLEYNKIILGEAKFYESLGGGLNKIIEDFTKNDICNKLDSLKRITTNKRETYEIVLKNLQTNEFEDITLESFLQQNLVFAGFVLHSETSVKEYGKDGFYDNYKITVNTLIENIKKSISGLKSVGDYEIILVHLPVNSKKELIRKMIEAAKNKLDILQRGHHGK